MQIEIIHKKYQLPKVPEPETLQKFWQVTEISGMFSPQFIQQILSQHEVGS
jgi:hypothetical protein